MYWSLPSERRRLSRSVRYFSRRAWGSKVAMCGGTLRWNRPPRRAGEMPLPDTSTALDPSGMTPLSEGVPATLDHLVWAAPDLDEAVQLLYERSGVRAEPGGQHPELGTHNALARIGARTYLEVLAPDPRLPAGTLARQLAALPSPALLMWAARTPDAAATAASAQTEGYGAAVIEGRRTGVDGEELRWTSVFVSRHGAGTLIPFFIQWHGARHPAAHAPDGMRLTSFCIETSRPESLRLVLGALDVKVTVRKGLRDRLFARMATPRGPLHLTGAED